MATIQRVEGKRGVRYKAIIRRKGHPTRCATFNTRTLAERWARKAETAVEEGRFEPISDAGKRTLAEAADRYYREILPELRTADARRRHVEWLVDRAGAYSLSRITPQLLAEYRDELAATPGSRRKTLPGPALVNRHLAAWSALFAVCVKRWHWMPANPCAAVAKMKGERARDRYLSVDERDRLVAACRASSNPMLLPAVLVSLSSGGRQGEVMGLRWRDVNLEAGRGFVARSKNEDPKALHIRGQALEALKRWQEQSQHTEPADFVFPGRPPKPGERPDRPIDLRAPFRAAVTLAGLQDFRWHDLRHSTGSYLAMSGATPSEIAEILGHRTLQMVKRYTRIADEHSSSVVDRMAAKFGL